MVEGDRAPAPRRLAIPPRLLLVLGAWGLIVGAVQLYALMAASAALALALRRRSEGGP